MKIIPLRSLGRIADSQICPRRRYWRWEHLGPGIEPYRPTWQRALETILAAQLGAVLIKKEPDPDPVGTCTAAFQELAARPGIRDLNPTNPADDAAEIGRLAGALILAWTRRRLPVLERSDSQPATIVIKVSARGEPTGQPIPDSRLFDLLINKESVLLESFVTGQRWNGWRFNNPLLYYWKTLKDASILWDKPEAKATCFEPPSIPDWIEKLEKYDDDPIGKVIKGGRVVTLPEKAKQTLLVHEGNIKQIIQANEAHGKYYNHEYLPGHFFIEHFHSCRGCEYAGICFGPEPFPKDATEEYPGIYKRREP